MQRELARSAEREAFIQREQFIQNTKRRIPASFNTVDGHF